ncbi:unnamed protein product [Ambrosiozyma monospora]|uniref:Unnamed protein product n=1 Tax=Ambrosiozyma monospora TaxID=43982 RepID=A0ACB5U7U8_AMBMO|nr:unnamed protein product [Ambrosiozyma monospora]
MIVSLTELLGLARWKENETKLGLDEVMVSNAIKISGNLLKHCYRVMTHLNEEQKHFESFIDWLNGILMDVTADEKSTEPVHTRNVIHFLNTHGAKINNNLKFSSLFEALNNQFSDMFKKVKNTMREGMCSEKIVTVGEVGASDAQMKLMSWSEKKNAGIAWNSRNLLDRQR